jgi:hypothetical protein
MRGVSFRRPHTGGHNGARLVLSIEDSTTDRFVPLEDMIEAFFQGKVKPVNIGNDYPNSFVRV